MGNREHTDWSFNLPLADDAELRFFVEKAWGVTIPDTQVCENHTTPWRAFADAYFVKAPVTVWKASRGFGGKSYLLALLGLTEAATLKADVNILGGSGEQSANVLQYVQAFWDYESAPTNLLAGDVKRETRLAWGNTIKALMASQGSVRGPHRPRLRLDEVDEMKLSIFDAAMGQTMAVTGDDDEIVIPAQTVVSSTHQNADGTMTEVLKRAGEKGWPVYEWCLDGDSEISTPSGAALMRDICPGDVVYAYCNGQIIRTRVTASWCSGERSTVVVRTDRGEVCCTPDHRILTYEGWKQAGELERGDLVCAMRDTQGGDFWSLQDLLRRQSLCGLWQIDKQGRNEMQVLCWQNQEQSPRAETKQNCLPEMWGAQAIAIQSLPRMLSQAAGGKKRQQSGQNGSSAPAYCREWQQPEAKKQTGAGSGRVARSVGVRVRDTATHGALHSGFCASRPFPGYRSLWSVLAHQRGTGGTRPTQGARGEWAGDGFTSLVGRSATSVVPAVVEEVGPGGTIPVYDLTVADGASFVANGIVVHNCYKETSAGPSSWLLPSEIERKRSEVTEAMWNTEYNLQEPSPESRAIQPSSVAVMFDKELGRFAGHNQEYIEIEPPEDGAQYATGADWARKKDWTVIVTLRIDCDPVRLVAFERCGRLPWPVMVGKFDDRLSRYGGRAAHDGTGLGDVVDGYMHYGAEGVLMVGRKRSDLLSDYIAAVERGEVVAPMIDFMHGEHKYASVDDVYGRGHLPDSIAAMALALRSGAVSFQLDFA